MPSQDPQSYVKIQPLPISSQKGLKLQARSAVIFNPITPRRDEIRKWNYDRRLQQMSEQGFNSCSYKPYKGLGDPFYLEEKKLILHSLGQWNATEDSETSSSSEDEEDLEGTTTVEPQENQTAAKFVLKRTTKNLNTLSKEVVKGRQLIRNVSLGHGLFNIIKQERHTKKAALMAEKKRSLEAARNQWQPPKDSSDEDAMSDNDIKNNEGPESNFGGSFTDSLSDEYDVALTSATNTSDYRPKTSSTKSSGKHKKQTIPRPFTPQHNNILDIAEYKAEICRSALFRQLCSLNWILDAMNLEQGSTMGPISTCWSHLDIGGSKISAKKAREDRRAEIDWERWLNNQQIAGRISKKGSITRLNRVSRSSRILSHPKISLQSRSISPSSSSSQTLSTPQMASLQFPLQANAAPNQTSVYSNKEMPQESGVDTPKEAIEEETLHKTGIFKFLDEYYDSLRREEERKREVCVEPSNTQEDLNQQPATEDKSKEISKRSAKKSKKSQDQQTPDRQSKSPDSRTRSRLNLNDLYNSFNNRSKSSPELMEFHANKVSNKYINLRQDLHNKLKEILDDKAMNLHDILEQMERERFRKCQTRYTSLNMRSMDFYRAVREMRREERRVLNQPEMGGRQSSIKGNWYTDLLRNLPNEVKTIWYYEVIIQKIGKYGLVENTSKQGVYKFLKVLEGLRHWEICSPDISAAIEFCRSKIVEISIDEYEEWFSQAFPKVLRPKTAPAGFRDPQHSGSSKSVSKNPLEDGARNSGGTRSESKRMVASSSAHSKRTTLVASGADGKENMLQSPTIRQR